MTIDDQIRDEKLQSDINREAAKISALSSNKIHKYEYLTGEDILPSNKQQIIEQAKFTYSPLGKAFKKQIETVKDQGKKHVDALNTLKSNNEKLEIENIIPKVHLLMMKLKKSLIKSKKQKILSTEKNQFTEQIEYTYNFRNFRTIRTFGRDFYEGKISLEKADEDQSNLMNEIGNFNAKTRPQNDDKKRKKEIILENLYNFFSGKRKSS